VGCRACSGRAETKRYQSQESCYDSGAKADRDGAQQGHELPRAPPKDYEDEGRELD